MRLLYKPKPRRKKRPSTSRTICDFYLLYQCPWVRTPAATIMVSQATCINDHPYTSSFRMTRITIRAIDKFCQVAIILQMVHATVTDPLVS
jgi:hypothetical protein